MIPSILECLKWWQILIIVWWVLGLVFFAWCLYRAQLDPEEPLKEVVERLKANKKAAELADKKLGGHKK